MLWGLVGLVSEPSCVACGEPLFAGPGTGLCAVCLDRVGELPRSFELGAPFASSWALAPYDEPVGAALRDAKFHSRLGAMRALGARLGRAARGRLPRVDAVVPVPIPWTRLLRRGFDQGVILGQSVARACDVPLLPALQRRPSAPMSRGADMKERMARARSSYRGRGAVPERVLLVDDVVTTGATARACADELLAMGARRVHFLALARRRSPDEILASRNQDDVM